MSTKIDENALTPCAKCECLILSDSSDATNDKCIRMKKPPGDAIIFKAKPSDYDASIDKSTSSSERNNRIEATSEDEAKHICFKFYRRKKKKDNVRDEGTQKSKPALATTKTQMSDAALGDFVKTTLEKKACQGGNTNTIIFQKDPASGDGIAGLESWLKMEAKMNSRNLEDILGELHKQRREILELKEMLDTVVRALRDQLFMTAFGKTKNELFTDTGRNTNLERKSNTLSITKSVESELKSTKVAPVTSEPPREKKRRRFCPWCK